MQTIENVTVADIASKSLAAVRVLEKLGIDYCCGGKRSLADACRLKGYDPAEVREELDEAVNQSPEPARDWTAAPLRELIDHIVGTHHAYLKRELPAIAARIEKVSQRHSETLPGLPEVFGPLRAEMELHLRKEEAVLFPAIMAGAFGLDLDQHSVESYPIKTFLWQNG